jgi:hypothetical protein
MTNFDEIPRRRFLTGAAAISAAGMLSGLSLDSAFAKAAMLKKPAPGFHRFKVGEFEATVVSMGR